MVCAYRLLRFALFIFRFLSKYELNGTDEVEHDISKRRMVHCIYFAATKYVKCVENMRLNTSAVLGSLRSNETLFSAIQRKPAST